MLLLCITQPCDISQTNTNMTPRAWRRVHRDLYKKAFFRGMVKHKIKQLHLQQNFLKFLLSNCLPSLTGPSSFPYFPPYLFFFTSQPFLPHVPPGVLLGLSTSFFGFVSSFLLHSIDLEDTSVDPQPNSSSEGEGRRMLGNTYVLLLVSLQTSHGLNQCSGFENSLM